MEHNSARLPGRGVSGLTKGGEEECRVVDMIGKYFCHLYAPGPEMGCGRRGSVDSYDEKENNSPVESLDSFELEEHLLEQCMTQQIERCLADAKASILRCQVLLLPRLMSARVVQDVVRCSAGEPCGLRGASIKVYLECKDGLKALGSISTDPDITPTFELSVVFKADDGWLPLKHLFGSSKVLMLRGEYQLVKRKLYSSASPVVHHFNHQRV